LNKGNRRIEEQQVHNVEIRRGKRDAEKSGTESKLLNWQEKRSWNGRRKKMDKMSGSTPFI
jgi:hypothetical protein